MSYKDIADISTDSDITKRILACVVQEGIDNPNVWVAENIMALASQPGWDSAWASAQVARQHTVGNDPGVITDGMILSAVQALNSSN